MRMTLAAIQISAVPFAVPHNLRRAREMVRQAVARGAQVVVLPELFNIGYTYHTATLDYAEPIDGVTAMWMCDGARSLGCYLAGAVLLRDCSNIYSTMLLATPDGMLHTYRKRYRLFWERGMCRAGTTPRPAQTPIGQVGMLVGADVAHPNGFAPYVGQVDLLLVSSTAIALPEAMVEYPDGSHTTMSCYYPALARRAAHMHYDYFEGIRQRTAALGVPLVHAVQCGGFRSPLPSDRPGLSALLTRLPQYLMLRLKKGQPVLRTTFLGHSAIFDAQGNVLAVLPTEEGVIVAEVDVGMSEMSPAPLFMQEHHAGETSV